MASYAPKFMSIPWIKGQIFQINISAKKVVYNSGNPQGNGSGLLYVPIATIGNQRGPFTLTYKNNGAQLKFFYSTTYPSSSNITCYEITPSSVTGDATNGYTYTFTVPSNGTYLYLVETGTYGLYYYVNAKSECIINSDMPVNWNIPSYYINYYDGTSWSKNKYLRKYNGSGWYTD